MTQKALDNNRTPDNLMGKASVLLDPGLNGRQPTEAELGQAFMLAKEAVDKQTEIDTDYVAAYAQLSLYTEHPDDLRKAVNSLKSKAPDLPITHYFNGILLANDGNLEAGEEEIKTAESLGFPPEATKDILTAIEEEKGNRYFGLGNYFYYGSFLVGAWLLGLAILFVAGKILSAKTLSSIESSDPNDITGGGHAGLRNFYKKLIAVAGIYYYISQPIIMLLIIVLTGAVGFFFLWIGQIPIKLLLIVGFVALATIFYMIKSLIIRAKPEEPDEF